LPDVANLQLSKIKGLRPSRNFTLLGFRAQNTATEGVKLGVLPTRMRLHR
jgi:hypothetical protein